jgi:diguanylate cyclase (GGDEF)-like protein
MIDPREALSVLLEITRSLTREHALDESLREITDAWLRLLPGEHASVRLLDDTGQELVAGARSGAGSTQKPLDFARGEGVIGWVAEHGEVARVSDTQADPRFKPASGQGFGVRSILAVPLWAGGNVVGVLAAASGQAGAFCEDDELMAQLLANCTSPLIERSRLRRLALTDEMTLAFNQRYFMPRLLAEIERAKRANTPLSLLFMDLDDFKLVNDEHGHAMGDKVLRAFADRVRKMVRRYDVFVRRGGDEFVLLMPSTDSAAARSVADRIRRSFEARRLLLADGNKLAQLVSIGVATWDGAEGARELEDRADQALYEAKRGGRNSVALAPQRSSG